MKKMILAFIGVMLWNLLVTAGIVFLLYQGFRYVDRHGGVKHYVERIWNGKNVSDIVK